MWNPAWSSFTNCVATTVRSSVMKLLKADIQPISSSSDVVLARQKVRQWATEMKFSLVEQTKLVTAASELARNALDHGKGGHMMIEKVENSLKSGLKLVFEDRGP